LSEEKHNSDVTE